MNLCCFIACLDFSNNALQRKRPWQLILKAQLNIALRPPDAGDDKPAVRTELDQLVLRSAHNN